MSASLVIHHRGGSETFPVGRTQEFDGETIRIGRAEHCELRFDPRLDRTVSTDHAEVLRDANGVRIVDAGSRNGVLINGERIDGEAVLQSGDLVRLGADGPQFEIRFDVGADADAVEEDLRTIAGGDLATIQNVQSPAVMAQPSVPTPSTPAPSTPVPPGTGTGASQGKQSVGLNTLMGVVDQTVQRERQRAKMVLIPVVGVLVIVVLALIFWPDEGEPKWDAILAHTRGSVYVCAKLEGGNASPFGTAWSIGGGKLATNSHVAIEFESLSQGQEFVVRSCSTPPRNLRIDRVTLHPAYGKWKDLLDSYDPFVPGTGFLRMLPRAFDVAILHVAEEDADALAPGLPIASRSDLLAVKDGEPLALIGYPMEGQAGRGVNMEAPRPQIRIGTVSRTTNYWIGQDSPEKSVLIGMDLTSAGGASGSPVLNAAGEVVALNSAGDYLDISIKGRRIRSGGAYGQRADVLQDLLDGSAKALTEDGGDSLESAFLQRFRRGVEPPDPCANWLARQLLKEGEALGSPYQTVVSIAEAGTAGRQLVDQFEVAAAGTFVRVILPVTRPIPPVVSTFTGRQFEGDKTIRYFLVDRWSLRSGSKPTTRIQVAADAELDGALDYVCFWFPVSS